MLYFYLSNILYLSIYLMISIQTENFILYIPISYQSFTYLLFNVMFCKIDVL